MVDSRHHVQVKPLASILYSNFNLRNEITEKNCSPPNFCLPTLEKIAPSYTSLDTARK